MTEQIQNITICGELLRKSIHIASTAIPIGYYFLDKKLVLSIIIPVLIILLIVEVLKYRSEVIYSLYLKLFKPLLRNHEFERKKFRINGASWVLIADVLCIILFPKLLAITGMMILSLSDSLSAIVGRVYGKKQFAPNRSYAGTITFFVVGVIIIFLTPKYNYNSLEYIFGIIAVAFATFIDSINFPTDDNFSIPLSASAVLYILYIIFLPGIL